MNRLHNPILRCNGWLAGAAFLCLLATPTAADPADQPAASKVEAAFGRDCETLLVREIGKAEKEISVAIYSITRRNIASALTKAVERGVKVRLARPGSQTSR
jgi:phosphatidylserine/phosphatidylglycerophosphate/cardiolipin synthase-like enzyme